MTNATPIAFLVDANGVPLRQGVVVDAATGAPTIVTINPATGLPVSTIVGPVGGSGITSISSAPDYNAAVVTPLAGKANTFTTDAAPTSASANPVQSGGVFAALAGKAAIFTTDAAPTASSTNPVQSGGVNTALAAKIGVPQNWNGTTPALVSSTNPIPAFGTNAFIYTGSTTATLDGLTFNPSDMAVFNVTSGVYTKTILGGGYLGSFASSAALQTAYPAASNTLCTALVAGAPFVSNGTAWAGVATLDSGGHLPASQSEALTGDVTSPAGSSVTTLQATAPALNIQATNAQGGTAYTLVLADAGQNVDMNNAAANTLTIPLNAAVAFPVGTLITVTQAGAGTTTIAFAGTVQKPTADSLSISAQYRTATLYKTATDTWRVLAN